MLWSSDWNEPWFDDRAGKGQNIDKDGNEKEFRVSEKLMKSEKFKAGDKVAEEREGVLISLETSKGREQ